MPNKEPISTHELLLQLKNEEEKIRLDAFETLYYRYKGPFYRYSLQQSLSEDAAASSANDSLVKVFRYRMRYQDSKHDHADSTANRYMWTIHERTVIDWLRKEGSVSYIYLDEDYLAPEITFPETYIEVKRQQELLQQALQSLSTSERLLLTTEPRRGRVSEQEKQERRIAFQNLKLALSTLLLKEDTK